MAHRKNYYPNRVSRNERLAFQLQDDPKMKLMDLRKGRSNNQVMRHERLAEFVTKRSNGNHITVF